MAASCHDDALPCHVPAWRCVTRPGPGDAILPALAGPVALWLAKPPDGGLVGQHVLLPMRCLVDGADQDGCLSFNALVDPRYHGQAIWTGLVRPLNWPEAGPDPTRATDRFLTTGDDDGF